MSADTDRLAAIELRAYYLWEQAGRPHGGDIAFWDEARQQVEREQGAVASAQPRGA